jgi:putative Mn2+ efflux pump MntP
MYFLTIITFAFVISMVPFSVALSSSIYRCIEWKESLLMAFMFAVIHGVMAMVGWGLGYATRGWLTSMGTPVAITIMLFIALRYFIDARRKGREARTITVKNMKILLGFATVTAINTLLLGIGLGILYSGWLDFIGVVFAVVFLVTRFGILAGKRGWMNLGRTAETVGSLLLFGITIAILLQYLKLI